MKWKIIFTLFFFGLAYLSMTARRRPTFDATVHPVRNVQRGIFAPGRVEGNTAEIELFANVREPVTKILVREGERVQAGDLMVQLNDQTYSAEVELTAAGVRLAQAQLDRLRNGARPSEIDEAKQQCALRNSELEFAQRVLERGQVLVQVNAISQQELDQYEANAKSAKAMAEAAASRLETISAPPRVEDIHIAEAQLASAQAQWKRAQATLAKTQLRAPCDGTILRIHVEPGEIQNDKPLVVLSDTASTYVRANVDEFDALRVEIGQPVVMTTNALPGKIIQGRITRLSPKMDEQNLHSERLEAKQDTRSREIWVEVEPGHSLIVGLPIELWIAGQDSGIPHLPVTPPRTARLR